MHEVAICQSIIETIEEELNEQELTRVREIHLKVGKLSCVDPGVLQHVFGYMIIESPFQNAQLKIQLLDIIAECEMCGEKFEVVQSKFICPNCNRPTSKILQGQELQINKIISEAPFYEEAN